MTKKPKRRYQPFQFKRTKKGYSWFCPVCRRRVQVRASQTLSRCNKCKRVYFDLDKADHVVKFFKCLKHTKDPWRGQLFTLLEWEENEILRPLFGTVREDGARQYRICFVLTPKKSGKTEFGGGIALYGLGPDGERGAEVYSAAVDREQASMVYAVAKDMVEMDETLSEKFKIIESVKRITYKAAGNFYRVLSSDVKSKHGANIHFLVFDELHAQPNRRLFDVTTKGSTLSRRQPLIFIITTSGEEKDSIGYKESEHARQVMEGIITDDPTLLPIVYAIKDGEDWQDEAVWAKVNPSLGHIFTLERLREEYRKAQKSPEDENYFRRMHVNEWVRQEFRFIDMPAFIKCARLNGYADYFEWIETLKGRHCYAGMDLSSKFDISAVVLLFPPEEEDGIFDVRCDFWIPQDRMKERAEKDKVPYPTWVDQGYIHATPGNVIDYRFIHTKISELADNHVIEEMAYDPWKATEIVQKLQSGGMEMVETRQGPKTFDDPTNELKALIISKRLRHGGHPVLVWMADNLIVRKDNNENIMPSKAGSQDRIDGIVALIMALGRAIRHETASGSVYETRGIITIG